MSYQNKGNTDFLYGPFAEFKSSKNSSNTNQNITIHNRKSAISSPPSSFSLGKGKANRQKSDTFPKHTPLIAKLKFIQSFLNMTSAETKQTLYPNWNVTQVHSNKDLLNLLNKVFQTLNENKNEQFFIRLFWKTPDPSLENFSPKDYLLNNFSIETLGLVVSLLVKSFGK